MRFKTDENLHPDAASLLREEGHDAVTVWDEQMRGRQDEELAAVCRSENRALITLDLHFADLRLYPPENYAGFIVFRLDRQDRWHVLQAMRTVLSMLKSQTLAGRLWILDEHSLRVRGGTDG